DVTANLARVVNSSRITRSAGANSSGQWIGTASVTSLNRRTPPSIRTLPSTSPQPVTARNLAPSIASQAEPDGPAGTARVVPSTITVATVHRVPSSRVGGTSGSGCGGGVASAPPSVPGAPARSVGGGPVAWSAGVPPPAGAAPSPPGSRPPPHAEIM